MHRGSKGGVSYTYAPTLRLRGIEPACQKIADWSDAMKANAFADWLRQKLGGHVSVEPLAPETSTDGNFSDWFGGGSLPPAKVEIPRPENLQARVDDGPRGREFYFPAARNPGVAVLCTFLLLAFGSGVYATVHPLLRARPDSKPWANAHPLDSVSPIPLASPSPVASPIRPKPNGSSRKCPRRSEGSSLIGQRTAGTWLTCSVRPKPPDHLKTSRRWDYEKPPYLLL